MFEQRKGSREAGQGVADPWGLMHGAMRLDGRHWEGEGCDPQHCPLFISHGEGHMAYRGYRVGKRTQKGQIGGAGVRDTS